MAVQKNIPSKGVSPRIKSLDSHLGDESFSRTLCTQFPIAAYNVFIGYNNRTGIKAVKNDLEEIA